MAATWVNRLTRRRRVACSAADERGSIMVEFAIVLPVLVLLTFGIIEFGAAFNASSTVAQGARAGGRTAAISSLDPQMEFTAANAAATSLNLSPTSLQGNPTICVGKYDASSSNPCGDFVQQVSLIHTGNPGDPVWQIDLSKFPGNKLPPTDSWPVAQRNVGCPVNNQPGTFDKVVVRVQVNHKLLVAGMFAKFFGNNSAPALTSSAVFQLEPVPTSSCS